MTTNPLVSIIMPAYNASAYIAEAIESVLDQTWTNWELIIVDDGSTDDTLQIAQQYVAKDNRIQVYHQSNQGVSSARNNALQYIQGDFVQYLDSDDVLDVEKLSSHINIIQEKSFTEHDLTYGICYNLTSDGRKKQTVMHELYKNYDNALDAQVAILENHFISFPYSTYLLPRPIVEQVGLWNPMLNRAEDSEYMLRVLSKVRSLWYVSQSIFYYREVDGSLSRRSLTQNQMVSEMIVSQSMADVLLSMKDNSSAIRACEIHYTDVLTAWYPQNKFVVKDILKAMKARGLKFNFENRGRLFHILKNVFGWRVAVIITKWKSKIR